LKILQEACSDAPKIEVNAETFRFYAPGETVSAQGAKELKPPRARSGGAHIGKAACHIAPEGNFASDNSD